MTTTEQPAQETAKPLIVLSDTAIAKVALLLAEEGEEGLGLRVAVRAGGCSGFSYEMFFDTETSSSDHVTTVGSVTVRVDSESAPHLVGATLNYRDGLQDAGFSIDNPNAQSSCGCGKSFS
ncbi:MAG: iron-sulfur cluster assembly accessory protein [Acidimicrobiales bacterium]|jgi:iron-sulfur cluster assembly accessory protein